MIIEDDYSRVGWPYFLKRKSDTPVAFERFLADVNATGVPSIVECVRSHNATEFVWAELVELLDRRGIRREYIPVGLPKQNDVVDRHIAMTLEGLFGDMRLPATRPLLAEA